MSISVRLVGRDSELAVLVSLVRSLRRGGQLAVVEGEAGIGKTRIVEGALGEARSNGAEVLSARAEELDAYRPFAPIVECVPESWRERVDVHLRAWETGPDAAAERQFRVAETVLELLDELCLRAPVVLAIEDLHWVDPATLGVLARVATSIDKLPVALVVSARPHPRPPELERLLGLLAARDAAIVRVGPLDERSCAELVQELVSARLPARRGKYALRLTARAGGQTARDRARIRVD